jgi:hypothetical protein
MERHEKRLPWLCGAQGKAKIGERQAVSLAIKDFQEDMHSIFSIVD